MANMDNYMAMLNPEMAAQVGSFYGYGGYGGYGFGGSASNPYANINPYRYSGMNPKDSPGDQLLADLIRASTRDFQTRYAPIEDMLANSITRTGTTYLEGDLERTNDAILGAARNVQGMTDRSANRLGINSAQIDPNSTTSTLVGGLNETRQRDSDRRLQLLTGGLSGITQNARNIG